MPTALLRGVPRSFGCALRADLAGPAPHPDGARSEHDGYAAALAAAGYDLVEITADESHPDCPFVEDTAVVLGGVALATRPGAPTRRGEVGPVAAELARHFEVAAMGPPATLDGGDVLQVGDRIFAGRSARTNDAGIERLAEVAGREVTPVDVVGALHLKSVVDVLAPDTVAMTPGSVDDSCFAGLRVVYAEPNVLRLSGSDGVLVAAHCDGTVRAVAAAGFEPVPVPAIEFAAADGGLTCLSIRWN